MTGWVKYRCTSTIQTNISYSEIKSILTQEGINDMKIVPKNTLIEINLDTDDFQIHENFYFKFSDEVTKPTSHEEVGKTTFKLLEKVVDKDYYQMYQ